MSACGCWHARQHAHLACIRGNMVCGQLAASLSISQARRLVCRNVCMATTAVLEQKTTLKAAGKLLLFSLLGNALGCFGMALMAKAAGLLSANGTCVALATMKTQLDFNIVRSTLHTISINAQLGVCLCHIAACATSAHMLAHAHSVRTHEQTASGCCIPCSRQFAAALCGSMVARATACACAPGGQST